MKLKGEGERERETKKETDRGRERESTKISKIICLEPCFPVAARGHCGAPGSATSFFCEAAPRFGGAGAAPPPNTRKLGQSFSLLEAPLHRTLTNQNPLFCRFLT